MIDAALQELVIEAITKEHPNYLQSILFIHSSIANKSITVSSSICGNRHASRLKWSCIFKSFSFTLLVIFSLKTLDNKKTCSILFVAEFYSVSCFVTVHNKMKKQKLLKGIYSIVSIANKAQSVRR